jgi:hypothetical protein
VLSLRPLYYVGVNKFPKDRPKISKILVIAQPHIDHYALDAVLVAGNMRTLPFLKHSRAKSSQQPQMQGSVQLVMYMKKQEQSL